MIVDATLISGATRGACEGSDLHRGDRKSTRLNSSHPSTSYAVFCLKKKIRLDAISARAVSFSASSRNSLVILPLAFAVPGGVPILPAVILTQTIVELCFLPVYVRVIPRLSRE